MIKKEMPDRRRARERRRAKRFAVTVDIEWEREGERFPGTVSDLSEGGCFVLTGGDVTDGEEIMLYIPIGDSMKAQFAGRVTNHVFEIGFAIEFTQLTEAQHAVLLNYLMGGEPAD